MNESRTATQGGYQYNGGVQPRRVPPPASSEELGALEQIAPEAMLGHGHVSAPYALYGSQPVLYGSYPVLYGSYPVLHGNQPVLSGSQPVESYGFAHSLPVPRWIEATSDPHQLYGLDSYLRSGIDSYLRSVPVDLAGMVDSNPDLLPASIGSQHPLPVPERPLNVMHVGPFFRRGGAERWLLDLIRHTDSRYLRFTRCVCTEPSALDLSYLSELCGAGVVLEAGNSDSVQRAAVEADVLLSWGVCLDDLLGDVRPPLSVQVVHGDGPINRHLLAHSRNSVDHVVAVSHSVRSRVSHDFPTTVIYNGIDAARLAQRHPSGQVRRLIGLREEDFVIGYVGRFATEKRVDVILDAVASLPQRFKAVLAGWGPLLSQLRQYAQTRLAGRCFIVGVGDDLGDVYRAFDAVCLVSNQEGFPLVMLEAMLCRRPFIATSVGGVAEVIEDRVNGLLTDGSADHLAECLWKLDQHAGWAEGLAAQGAATAEQFAFATRMARDYEYLLHRLWNQQTAA